MRALARYLPALASRLPHVPLGDWPTPVREQIVDGRALWVKDEGASSSVYGGNKIRTLELWLGHARERGARRLWAIGAVGSNHVLATVVHAPRAGIEGAAILFPQPASEWADENWAALRASGCPIIELRSVAQVPFVGLWVAARERDAVVMPPGGASPIGTFGAVSAVFELADQIAAGLLPPPRRIVLAIGSTCTTAGLLAGTHLAAAMGVWRWPLPVIHAVRVTPWPVTAAYRVVSLAERTLARAALLGGPRIALAPRALAQSLVIDGRELGAGYGTRTPAGDAATAALRPGPRLDGVYTAKAAAAVLRVHRAGVGPLLFWATKSAVQPARVRPGSGD